MKNRLNIEPHGVVTHENLCGRMVTRFLSFWFLPLFFRGADSLSYVSLSGLDVARFRFCGRYSHSLARSTPLCFELCLNVRVLSDMPGFHNGHRSIDGGCAGIGSLA